MEKQEESVKESEIPTIFKMYRIKTQRKSCKEPIVNQFNSTEISLSKEEKVTCFILDGDSTIFFVAIEFCYYFNYDNKGGLVGIVLNLTRLDSTGLCHPSLIRSVILKELKCALEMSNHVHFYLLSMPQPSYLFPGSDNLIVSTGSNNQTMPMKRLHSGRSLLKYWYSVLSFDCNSLLLHGVTLQRWICMPGVEKLELKNKILQHYSNNNNSNNNCWNIGKYPGWSESARDTVPRLRDDSKSNYLYRSLVTDSHSNAIKVKDFILDILPHSNDFRSESAGLIVMYLDCVQKVKHDQLKDDDNGLEWNEYDAIHSFLIEKCLFSTEDQVKKCTEMVVKLFKKSGIVEQQLSVSLFSKPKEEKISTEKKVNTLQVKRKRVE